MAFAALSINSKRKLLDEWHEEDADDEGGDEEEHEPKGPLPMEELQPVPPRAIFDALNVHPPPNLSTQDLDHPFNRKAFGELYFSLLELFEAGALLQSQILLDLDLIVSHVKDQLRVL